MHANDIFLFFKKYFLHQHIETIQNILNFSKNKIKIKFFENVVSKQAQTVTDWITAHCLLFFIPIEIRYKQEIFRGKNKFHTYLKILDQPCLYRGVN